MRKIAMLMVIGVLAVSAYAEVGDTYQLVDFIPSPDFDAEMEFSNPAGWKDWSGYDAVMVYYVYALQGIYTGWYDSGRIEHTAYIDIGEDADTGTQAVVMLSGDVYGPSGIKCLPYEYLWNNSTYEFTFKAKRDNVTSWYDAANNPADIEIFYLDGVGGVHNQMTIPGSSLTDEWQEFTYSEAYDGELMDPEGWSLVIRAAQDPNGDFKSVLIDSVDYATPPVPLLPGDANRDGVVSAGDYASIQSNFGNTGEPGIPGDANGDGIVDATDYAAVKENFGNTAAASSIPEPATMSLLVIGAVSLIRRKK